MTKANERWSWIWIICWMGILENLVAQLSSLFITTPVRFTGRVIKYLGRILRTAEGKAQPKVFDYVDKPGVLRNSFRSRCNDEKMGVVLTTSQRA